MVNISWCAAGDTKIDFWSNHSAFKVIEKGITELLNAECLFSSYTEQTASMLSLRNQFNSKAYRTGGFHHISLSASRLLMSALTSGNFWGTEHLALHRKAQRNWRCSADTTNDFLVLVYICWVVILKPLRDGEEVDGWMLHC